MKLIDKDRIVAEIKRRFDEYSSSILKHYDACKEAKAQELGKILTILDTLEVKEVDLDKEIEKEIETRWRGEYLFTSKFRESAKHFFELGLNASNPIAKENLESFVRQVFDLDIEAGEYYNNIIEEERRENGGGGSDLMINLLCGTIDAKELSIQYVLNKLKAQKGE